MEHRYTYFAIALDQLDSVRAWVLDLNNQAQLVENLEGESVSYKVCIHDVLEPTCATNKSGEFAALFGLEALV